MVNRIQKFLNVMFFILIFITILTIITPTINASPYDIRHVNLLAVQEINNMTYVGSTADLYLEVRDGTGRVFLDTSPLTKIDTQISTRYAKDIACDYFDLDCDQYDFIYTIRAKSSIIGGPSAGAAMSALTAITVLDLEHDESVAVTGTINSGGIIGPVGAVEEKVITAFEHNLSKVLVSLGSTDQFSNEIKLKLGLDIDLINYNIFNVTNESSSEIIVIDYFNYSYGQVLDNELSLSYEEMDLEVKEVIDLNELVYELTNVQVSSDNYEIEVDSSYNDIMLDLAEQLCGRSEELEDLFKNNYQLSQNFSDLIEERRLAAEVAQANGDYYSAASFCFGINLEFTHEFYIEEDLKVPYKKNGGLESKGILLDENNQPKKIVQNNHHYLYRTEINREKVKRTLEKNNALNSIEYLGLKSSCIAVEDLDAILREEISKDPYYLVTP